LKDLEGLNFDHLRRKRAFQLGKVPHLEEEFVDEGKTKLRGFWDMLDYLPV
jgi:hypothetical protein